MRLISPHFPFSLEELQVAFARAFPPDEAKRIAERLAMAARSAERPGSLHVPVSYAALLAALSPDLARRCNDWRAGLRRASRSSRERAALAEARLPPGTPPTAAISARLDAEDHQEDQEWEALCVQASNLPSRTNG